jgi:prepilin-type processing-associated H-X9-DG protein
MISRFKVESQRQVSEQVRMRNNLLFDVRRQKERDSSSGLGATAAVRVEASSPPDAAGAHPRFAFTLIELLVLIGILSVLTALLMPAMSRAKEAGRSAACISNLRQIGIALQVYVDGNHNRLPFMRDQMIGTNQPTNSLRGMNVVLRDELGNTNVLRCPSDRQAIFELTGSSYAWNSLLNGQPADNLNVMGLHFDPHAIPVAFDKEAFHAARGANKGVNYLYADGHIKNLLAIEGTIQR